MSKEKFYTTKELTDYFKVSRYCIYRANQSGALPVAKREGTQNLYSEADVKRYMEQSAAGKIVSK